MALVKAVVLENRFEEDLVSKALSERGIAFRIRHHHDTAYDGLYVPQQGWASVWTSEEDRELTASIVAEVRRAYSLRVL
jgi:hypothetical protein